MCFRFGDYNCISEININILVLEAQLWKGKNIILGGANKWETVQAWVQMHVHLKIPHLYFGNPKHLHLHLHLHLVKKYLHLIKKHLHLIKHICIYI